jgi:hypothetical protein
MAYPGGCLKLKKAASREAPHEAHLDSWYVAAPYNARQTKGIT